MSTNRNKNIVKLAGWGISLMAFIYTVVGYIDIASDASTKAYAPLVILEGALFISIGLIVVWMGRRKSE
ncbi:MAG: hypothetical protein WC279_00415 [Sulfurimonas sp.]|jgi:hypothetical protein|uniref:hypothetical protein n=1 Tax=unclassified Sulfurimonas TaxID=2623549 RepID=UPI0008C65617|nr:MULTISPECIES: hypothetical protein [unclassified Sulfurimonas]MBS4067551.1 hypothetical protein [Sulfurimonas sp.]MDD3854177.1 hypothetical protein [Sulfurimonas sp.]MDX9757283.1 hypothetical protein [Sulfurimonas sp.]OHE03981.1 MAG: hypothetical protein A2345_03880 [Sulfurimonas sp. RIFOXYB12_FULL_35_9]